MQAEAVLSADVVGLDALRQKIEQWRNQRPRIRAMPEELWQEAGEAARRLGVCRVSRALRLGYVGLRRRAGSGSQPPSRADQRGESLQQNGEFVELAGFSAVRQAPGSDETVVEVAAPDGTRLTIRLKGSANVAALVNALRWRA
jgi:hypothetical protein